MRISKLFFAVLLLWQCQTQPSKEASLRQRLDALFAPMLAENLNGGAVHVEMGGKVLFEKSFGYADFTTKEKFTANTVANLGSISKTFVAYGILKLQEQGQLSIDDPILKYFPDFKNKDLASKITIRHFLTHTSGIPDSRNVGRDSVFYLIAKDAENFAPLKQTDTLEFEPGTNWNYSNPAFNGLALIIEQVSGMKWQDYISANIFEPSGMASSKITDGSYPDSGVAHAYIFQNGKPVEFDYGEFPTFCASGNGGVWSSISDLRKYYQAIKNHDFVSPQTIDLSQTLWKPAVWKQNEPPLNGLCWFVYEKNDTFPYKMVEHTGSQGGFTAIMTMIPEKDLLILMEFNTERQVKELREQIITALRELKFL